jgi:hypothetical protein
MFSHMPQNGINFSDYLLLLLFFGSNFLCIWKNIANSGLGLYIMVQIVPVTVLGEMTHLHDIFIFPKNIITNYIDAFINKFIKFFIFYFLFFKFYFILYESGTFINLPSTDTIHL